jgi:hypothetical protein
VKKLFWVGLCFGLLGCDRIGEELGIGPILPKPPEGLVRVTISVALETQQFFHFESSTWRDVPVELLKLRLEARPVGEGQASVVEQPVLSPTLGELKLELKPGSYQFVVTELASAFVAKAQFNATIIGAQKIHVKTRAVLSKLEVELPNSLKPGQEVIGSVVVRNDEFRVPVENESSRFRVVVEGSGVARVIGGSAGVGVMTSSDAVAGDVVRLRFSATGFDGERPTGLELVRELVVEP